MQTNIVQNTSKSKSVRKNDIILKLDKITKKYPGVTALSDVSFEVRRGKILSLIGENGAGKSTLLKVISGVIPSTSHEGTVYFDGERSRFQSIGDSESKGIAIIHQELSISPFLPVYENVFMGHYRKKFGVLNWNEMIRESKKWLDLVGLTNVNVEDIAGNLSVAQQQLVEIAKALSQDSKLLILDEPTSSLNDKDSYKLLDLMKKLRDEQNITSIFVSHKLNEVEYVADDIVVIRDGKFISSYNNEETKITEQQLIKDIVGRSLEAKFPPKPENRKIGEETLRVENFKVQHPKFSDVYVVKNGYFNVKAGEIVGLSGLVGSGRSELALSVFGKQFGTIESGEIYINKKKVNIKRPLEAIKMGLMYASEDRKLTGLIQMFTIDNNIGSASLHLYTKASILQHNRLVKNSMELREKLKIKVPDIQYNVETLSGGNQQKVVIAKALTTKFQTLIIDEPTKGIDVGSKYEIYKIIFDLAAAGKSVIVISSELEELIGLTDRIFVMDGGYVKGEIKTSEATQEKIFEISVGKVKENVKTK
ncbi:sugar ABC transporter ATP-binding protein [Mycoplasmopsis agassizii]|uniref:sugar ABC transporter ATP-binding protein n=1 Tax=Mycoplasmopsis agassizii TaxID=33922 RepID=UPI0035284635